MTSRKCVLSVDYRNLLLKASSEKKSLSGLARDLGWSLTTISKMATELERKGLVNKVFGGQHKFVQLTEEGRGILEMIKE